jgi:hypothetical protein
MLCDVVYSRMRKIQKPFSWASILVPLLFLTARPACIAVPTAADAFKALGTAGLSHWQVLEVGNGTVTEQVDLSNPQGSITGNVGITKNGKFQDSGPTIFGNLYLGTKASAKFSGKYANNRPVTGTVFLSPQATVNPNTYSYTKSFTNVQPILDTAAKDAKQASDTAKKVPKTSNLTQINLSHINMTLQAGVYDLTTFSLDHSTLTLSGPGYFIFNITSTFKLSTGKVFVANGAKESHVLFNYTGSKDVAFSGGTGGANTNPLTNTESVLHGIILALNANVNLAPGLVVGEIISGKNISIVSGAKVDPPHVSDYGSTSSLGLLAFAGLVAFRRFLRRAGVSAGR